MSYGPDARLVTSSTSIHYDSLAVDENVRPDIVVPMKRDSALDAIRGLAALSVVLFHIRGFPPFNLFNSEQAMLYRTISLGHEAVVLFFVMSGYVLFLQMQKQKISYFEFILKRIARIYPAYMVAILISITMQLIFHPIPNPKYHEWINVVWTESLTAKLLFEHFSLLLPGYRDNLDSAVWSLAYEMRLSLFFPVIYYLAKKNKWTFILFISCLFLVADVLILDLSGRTGGWANAHATWSHTLAYVIDFSIGACLAQFREKISISLTKVKGLALAAFGSGIVVYQLSYYVSFREVDFYTLGWHLTLIIGVVLILVGATNSSVVRRVLNLPMFVWLGTISYSLYLLHEIVFESVLRSIGPEHVAGKAMLVVVVVSLIVATISYRCVELPFMNWVKKMKWRKFEKHAL
jgi:peptidoglycan/LPS O-acetylase OafA/YrhL